jgi:hypothetical protein
MAAASASMSAKRSGGISENMAAKMAAAWRIGVAAENNQRIAALAKTALVWRESGA